MSSSAGSVVRADSLLVYLFSAVRADESTRIAALRSSASVLGIFSSVFRHFSCLHHVDSDAVFKPRIQ